MRGDSRRSIRQVGPAESWSDLGITPRRPTRTLRIACKIADRSNGGPVIQLPIPPAPWPDRIIASSIEEPAQKANHTLTPGQPASSGCAEESGLCMPAPRTATGEYIVPTDHMGSYRECTGWDISGCQRIWRQGRDAPMWSKSRKPWCEACGAEYGVARWKWIPKEHGPTWDIRREVAAGFAVYPEYPEINGDVYTVRIPSCGTSPPVPYFDDGAPRSSSTTRIPDQAGTIAEFRAGRSHYAARRGDTYCDRAAERNQNRTQEEGVEEADVCWRM